MLRRTAISMFALGLILVCDGCLDPYNAPTSKTDVRELVVDGFLNATEGTCTVQISRTLTVSSYQTPPIESGAKVTLVDGNTSYALTESPAGTYTASGLPFVIGDQVQLRITTKDKVDYESTVVAVMEAPPIDSVSYESKREGVTIQVSAHNTTNNKYFYWKYLETWYHAAGFQTAVKLDANLNIVPLTENIYDCWTTQGSTDILVSTSSMHNDGTQVLALFPLTTVLWESPKLQSRYSIEVEQRVISKEMFEYLEQLKKNTENLGTLFDPLPSSPAGNITCISNLGEKAQGHFFASTVHKKRIFFSNSDLNRPAGTRSVTGNEGCLLVEIRMRSDWMIFVPVSQGMNAPVMGTTKQCVDCRLNGGTNVQPDFWQW